MEANPEMAREVRPVGTRVARGQNEHHLHVRRGETFGGILAARGVGAE